MSRDQNAGRSHNLMIDNSSFERVEDFRYLVTTLTNQNSIQKEIKFRLKIGNACYRSVQNFLSTSLLTKNFKIRIYRTIILLVVLYGCEIWSLTLKEERRLRDLENRVLRRIFAPKRDEVTEKWGNYVMRKYWSVLIQYFVGNQIEKKEMRGACSTFGKVLKKDSASWNN